MRNRCNGNGGNVSEVIGSSLLMTPHATIEGLKTGVASQVLNSGIALNFGGIGLNVGNIIKLDASKAEISFLQKGDYLVSFSAITNTTLSTGFNALGFYEFNSGITDINAITNGNLTANMSGTGIVRVTDLTQIYGIVNLGLQPITVLNIPPAELWSNTVSAASGFKLNIVKLSDYAPIF